MAGKREIHDLLKAFSLRKQSATLPIGELLRFTGRYIERLGPKNPELRDLATDTPLKLKTHLEELASSNVCTLQYNEGKLSAVNFPLFYQLWIKARYQELADDPDLPFPTEQSLGVAISPDLISTIDVKTEFVAAIEEEQYPESTILRLGFPDGIPSIIALSDSLDRELMRLSLHRIRQYLGLQKNAFYMASRLRSVFRAKEQIVKDMIGHILTQRAQATESLIKPTEFSFSFWTNLANAIIKEFREKPDRLEREHTFYQAAYMIGFYAVRFKSARRKEQESVTAFKTLDRKLRGEPYVFTVSQIANITDDKGIPLTRKYSRDELIAYLQRKSTSSDPDALPEILRLRADGTEYFVHKDTLLPLALRRVNVAAVEFKDHYIKKFTGALNQLKKLPEMKSDQEFLSDVDERLKTEHALLVSLLNYELLFLLVHEQKPGQNLSTQINRMLDSQHQKIIQSDELLGLSRKDLLNDARSRVPLWKTIPVLNKILAALGRMAVGQGPSTQKARTKKKATRSSKGSATTASTKVLGNDSVAGGAEGGDGSGRSKQTGAVALQKAMSKLKVEFIGNADLRETLDELIEKWNPLFDAEAKANLVEDTNSLIRDFLRKLKRSFLVRPPDAARIRTMATSLSENEAFAKIKRKDDLMRYIELYMIRVLGGK